MTEEEDFLERTQRIYNEAREHFPVGVEFPPLEEYRDILRHLGFGESRGSGAQGNPWDSMEKAIEKIKCDHPVEMIVNPDDKEIMSLALMMQGFKYGYESYPRTELLTDPEVPVSYCRWKHHPEDVAFEEFVFYREGRRDEALERLKSMRQIRRIKINDDQSVEYMT